MSLTTLLSLQLRVKVKNSNDSSTDMLKGIEIKSCIKKQGHQERWFKSRSVSGEMMSL